MPWNRLVQVIALNIANLEEIEKIIHFLPGNKPCSAWSFLRLLNSYGITMENNCNYIAIQVVFHCKKSEIEGQNNCNWTATRLFCLAIPIVLQNDPNGYKKNGSAFLHSRYAKILHKIEFSKSCFLLFDKAQKEVPKYAHCIASFFTHFMNLPTHTVCTVCKAMRGQRKVVVVTARMVF